MDNLTITISGSTNTGKTTLAYAIRQFLETHGISVAFEESEMTDKWVAILHESIPSRLELLAPKLSVEILEQQIIRPREEDGPGDCLVAPDGDNQWIG